jgi:hypothetical protein
MEVSGEAVPLFVNDSGIWTAKVGQADVHAETREGLRAKIQRQQRKNKVTISLPFTRLTSSYTGKVALEDWTATGMHQGNGNVLAQNDADGSREQLTGSFREGETFKRLTSEQKKELLSLLEAKKKADDAVAAFRKEYSLPLSKAMEKAIEKKVAEQQGN